MQARTGWMGHIWGGRCQNLLGVGMTHLAYLPAGLTSWDSLPGFQPEGDDRQALLCA